MFSMRLSTILRRGATAVLSVCTLALICDGSVQSAFAGACCDVNNSGCIYSSPMTYGSAAWPNLCSSIKSSTGNTCVANVTAGSTMVGNSVASGDCITLGSSTTLNLADATIRCTGTNCGSGILNTTSGGASLGVSVTGGEVLGCFSQGVSFTGGTNSTLTGTKVDYTPLGSACTNGLQNCVFGTRGTTSRVQLHHCFVGVNLTAGEDVNDSFIEGSYIGVYGQATSSISTLNNVSFTGNGYDVMNLSSGGSTYKIKILTSSLQQTGGCPCVDSNSNCITPVTNCINFGTNSTGNATYVEAEETFYP